MEKLTINDIIKATNGKLLQNVSNYFIENISIDSREITSTSLFIPIIGEVYDAHDFMEQAYNNGCRTFLIDEKHSFLKEDVNLIEVVDTKIALGNISKYYRDFFEIDYIAITGSVGKTTTKDMTYSVLNTKYNTLKNEENLNNEIGVPKTLFRLNKEHEKAIIEMGMQHPGEILYLKNIVRPKISVITKIGTAHIEFFENQEGIFNAKMEIADNFNEENILIVNGDDDYLKTLKSIHHTYKLLTYGFEPSNDLYCKKYAISGVCNFTCVYNNKEYDFTIPTPAKHNILNAMAAIMVGIVENVSFEDIKEGLKNFKSSKNRMEIFEKDGITIINDSYNASFDSMKGMIDVLDNYKPRKVAILGDMYELGSKTEEIHEAIGNYFREKNIDFLITVGQHSKTIRKIAIKNGFNEENTIHFDNVELLLQKIDEIIKKDDTILLKASLGVSLSLVADYFKNK